MSPAEEKQLSLDTLAGKFGNTHTREPLFSSIECLLRDTHENSFRFTSPFLQ